MDLRPANKNLGIIATNVMKNMDITKFNLYDENGLVTSIDITNVEIGFEDGCDDCFVKVKRK